MPTSKSETSGSAHAPSLSNTSVADRWLDQIRASSARGRDALQAWDAACALEPQPAASAAPSAARARGAVTAARPAADAPGAQATRTRFLARGACQPSQLDYERVLGTHDLLDLNYLSRGLRVARAVGRIVLRDDTGREIGFGTGFLVSPRLLLTNHHVLDSAQQAQRAAVDFDYQLDDWGRPQAAVRFELQATELFIADAQADCALVHVAARSMDGQHSLAEFGFLPLDPQPGKIGAGEWATIIQHPSGSPKQIAMRENQVLKLDDTAGVLWYASDTAPGSSGAPVFNDSWQVAALHHAGLPDTDAEGRWLDRQGRPIRNQGRWLTADGLPPPETEIRWKANEGVRISRVTQTLQRLAAEQGLSEHPAYREFLACCDDATQGRSPRGMAAQSVGANLTSALPVAAPSSSAATVVLGASQGLSVQIDASKPPTASAPLPIEIRLQIPLSIQLLGAQVQLGNSASNNPGSATSPMVDPAMLAEKLVIDPNYGARTGYDPKFLGVSVPLPKLSPALAKLVTPPSTGGQALHYHHYSLVMHSERRMPIFTACNYDGSKKGQRSRTEISGGSGDSWVFDPRIPTQAQIPSSFYGGNAFDMGHVVKREDVYWGDSEDDATQGNNDSFHLTNCTPQHQAFNQASRKGIWGRLEDHISRQGKGGLKASIFAGPVFAATDQDYKGVKIPRQFWKVVVCGDDDPKARTKLHAFGFLLSQAGLVDNMEAAVFSAAGYETYLVPLEQIQKLTGLQFGAALLKANKPYAAAASPKVLTNIDDVVI